MKNLTESTSKSAYLYIIKLLTKKDYSEHKLRVKLGSKGYEEADIDLAIEEVISKGFLREKEYATARAKVLMKKGYHPQYIEAKLAEEQLSVTSSTINEIFEEYNMTTDSQLSELLEKKLRIQVPSQLINAQDKIKQKLIRYCLTKGHELEDITNTLEGLLEKSNS
ncbi:regulatory protein RecX [Halobacteriovorax sp.]|uniref:regulatory protein RecX n=1 Tax=Halobacteriovorax sp. TaxID=2020862 RepID=UPI00356943DA